MATLASDGRGVTKGVSNAIFKVGFSPYLTVGLGIGQQSYGNFNFRASQVPGTQLVTGKIYFDTPGQELQSIKVTLFRVWCLRQSFLSYMHQP